MTAISLLAATPALALPQGGQVVGGQANIATSGSQTTITQSTHRGIINWQSFDIGHGEAVHFQQPSASSVTLNRVTGGGGASQLLGNLTANGTVMLVNPQGTFIGPNANVNVGSFIATTSDISNDRLMAGDYRFDIPGNPNAGIVNLGSVTVADAGLAAFVAPNVVNNGVIQAKLGKVQLASGDAFTLDLYGDGLIALEAGPTITSQLVSNGGIIAAEGGKVLMTAAAAGEVVNSLINMDGIISATSIGEQNGEIVIFAEGSNAVSGNDSAKKGQKQGSSTVLVSGVLDASGRGEVESGGKITVTGDNVALLNGTIIDASGHTGASGTTAGKTVSAHRDGSAGGDIRIGGDYLGQGDTPTARNLYVDSGALVLNDAIHTGDAGRSIFWSDGTTQFYGNVYARALGGKSVDPLTWSATAGGNPGDGGFVETSGYEHLDVGGYVNLTASSGNRGTYFLDPTDITIYGNVDPAFQSTDGSIDLASSLKLWLDASDISKVTLTYSTNGVATTANGTAGSNTITTAANVSANLAVGARIRLGTAGATTTADTMGDHTYTIASISGTTITLAETLTQNYTTSTLYRGLVSQLADKSGQAHHATQVTDSNMPLWVSNGQNGLGVLSFLEASSHTLTVNASVGGTTSATAFTSYTPSDNSFGVLGTRHNDSYFRYFDSFGYIGTFRTSRVEAYPSAMPNTGSHIVSLTSSASAYEVFLDGLSKGSTPPDYNAGNHLTLGQLNNTGPYNGTIADAIIYGIDLTTTPRNLVEQYQSAKWNIALTPPGTGATEVTKATAADGYSAFTTRYLERLSQTADISLQATNSITLDLKGDTLALASDRNFSLTTTNGNISSVSAGTISTTRTGSGGNITMTAGGSGTIDVSNLTLNANNGGSINLTSPGAMTLGTMNAGSILARTTGASSDLTIAAGKTISASASGSAITLASGRNLINNAGSGAFSTPSGRWLVYSTSPGNDTIGSLANDFRRFSCTYGGSCPSFPASGNGFLYGSTPLLTVNPAGGFAVTYGDDAPNLSVYAYTLSGYLGDDAGSDSVTGSLNGSTPYAAGNNVGSYAINHASGSLASELGYGFSYVSNATGITVAPRTLTASLTGSVSKVYDGTTAASLSAGNYLLSNIYSSDEVGITNTAGIFDTKNAGAGKTVTVNGLTLSGAASGNYQLASSSVSGAIGSITQKLLSIAGVTASNKVYDGTTAATLSGASISTVTGLVAGDVVNLLTGSATGIFADKNVGTTKTVTVSGYAINGADAGNYSLSQPTGLTATISPRPLTASLTGTVRKVFDGTTAASLKPANYLLPGIISGESVSLNFPATGSFNNSEVGTGKLVTVTGLALIGADIGNYLLASDSISGTVGTIDASLGAGEAARVQLSQQPSMAPSGFVYSPGNGHMTFISTPRTDSPSQVADLDTLSPSFGGQRPQRPNIPKPEIAVDQELQIEFDLPPSL